ncbi:MAG: SPFH domain-containing protein [Clostridiaceae bacterium]|jgi:membrane protease subunit (stomatin/prohibitin family)|nr:SPFH domain-containing protein [Clostridia bacterium]MBP6162318.1 SPFH domain-containing protein [Clostridia bacterium]MBP6949584.1 SPFH domain-containing protein [Clostridia bacterium]NMA36366.1 SPFH domain-containing protein [Clostridiaceae bacterium]
MGLLKAAGGAIGGVLADQWREFFYCDALPDNVIVKKGQKRTSARSSNVRGEDNIISNGSIITVNNGQCMIIVEQGRIVEFCADPGEYVYDMSTEPSLFYGPLGKNIVGTFKRIGQRFTFGGDTGKDQRVYYFNLKEMMNNRFGTANAVPFRVVDKNIGLDVDIAIKCFGEYSYKVENPLLFYTNVSGNVEEPYTRDQMDNQLRAELMNALQPAFAKISELGIRYSALPGHTEEISNALNEVLTEKWRELRGIVIVSVAIQSVKASEEDEQLIKDLQKSAVFRDPTMAAAGLVGAQADAMRAAAANEGAGPFMAFAGMNMAQMAGGGQATQLFQQGAVQPQPVPGSTMVAAAVPVWKCTSCGKADNVGKFCGECGSPKPVKDEWQCVCGAVNTGNFCHDCGKPRPVALHYQCDKCGWEPEDQNNVPKFCPNCGDVFDEKDVKGGGSEKPPSE